MRGQNRRPKDRQGPRYGFLQAVRWNQVFTTSTPLIGVSLSPRTPLLQIQVTATSGDINDLEHEIDAVDDPEVLLGEIDPGRIGYDSTGTHIIVISVASAGGLKALRDVLIMFMKSRMAKIAIVSKGKEVRVEFQGPLKSQKEIDSLVEHLSARESS